jgi:hypothetical protein
MMSGGSSHDDDHHTSGGGNGKRTLSLACLQALQDFAIGAATNAGTFFDRVFDEGTRDDRRPRTTGR